MRVLTTIEQGLKDTASNAMGLAAAQTNRLRSLKSIADSGLLTEQQFMALVGQATCTMERDLQWAEEAFQRMKTHYEAVCRILAVPAYATYNED